MTKRKSTRPVPDSLPAGADKLATGKAGQTRAQGSAEKTLIPGNSPVEWDLLVSQIKAGDEAGVERLYKLFSSGVRYYLCRQLGPQDLEDNVNGTLLGVINSILQGDLHEPELLSRLVLTVVRRQVAAYIKEVVRYRREHADSETGIGAAGGKQNPEQDVMLRQQEELMENALGALSERDREILIRHYQKGQSQDLICQEMELTHGEFRLLKLRAKEKFVEISKRKLAVSGLSQAFVRTRAKDDSGQSSPPQSVEHSRVSLLMKDPIVQVLMTAATAFQHVETGRLWLNTPNRSLGNEAPISMISTESGRQKVINELGLIEHGMF